MSLRFLFGVFALMLAAVPGHAQNQALEDAYRARQAEIGKAFDARNYDRALALANAHLAQAERDFGADSFAVLTALDDMGEILDRAGRVEASLNPALRAARVAQTLYGATDKRLAPYLRAYAVQLTKVDRDVDAEPHLVRALSIMEAAAGPDSDEAVAARLDLAFLFKRLGRSADALVLNTKLLTLLRPKRGDGDRQVMRLLDERGLLLDELRRRPEARAAFDEAYAVRVKAEGKDKADAGAALNGRIGMCYEDGFPPECAPLAERSYLARRKLFGEANPETMTARMNQAAILMGQKKYVEADAAVSGVMDIYRTRLGATAADTAKQSWALAYLRLASGSLAGTALAPARVAAQFERDQRGASGRSVAAQTQFEAEDDHGFAEFVTVADAGWMALKQGKAAPGSLDDEIWRVLQEAVAGAADQAAAANTVRLVAQRRSPAIADLVRSRQDLAQRWQEETDKLSALLSGEADGAAMQRDLALVQRGITETHMDGLDERLRREFPEYFSLIRPQPLSIADTQKMLADDEAVLMLVPTHFGTQILAVSKTGFVWQRAQIEQNGVSDKVQRLLFDLGAEVQVSNAVADKWLSEGGSGYPFDRKTAHALYMTLIEPAAPVIAGKKHLFVAMSGALTSLPLGVLVTEAPQGADGDADALRATKWLADAHAITVIPSVRALFDLRSGTSASGKWATPLAGFGDPTLAGPDQCGATRGARGKGPGPRRIFTGERRGGKAMANVAELRKMKRLPCTATELEAMRQATGAPVAAIRTQGQATETALRTADLSQTRILALATHGLVAGEIGGIVEPGLVMTPPASPSDADDGYVSASEIAALRIAADWVILSACNTAAGNGRDGAPGLSGLARAFFFAGARNLLVSHWQVRDDVAPKLTVATVSPEAGVRSRAEALQMAARAVRMDKTHDGPDAEGQFDTWAHPNAWAAFSLIGDGAR